VSVTIEALAERLRDIPHLDLGLQFDAAKMMAECEQIGQEYTPYKTRSVREAAAYAKAWAGRSLIGYDYDSREGMHEHTDDFDRRIREQDLRLQKTDLGEKCPYLIWVACSLHGDHNRTRVMQVAKGGHLAWHSHVQNHGQSTMTLTVHVPIVMPETFTYQVTHSNNLRLWQRAWQVRSSEHVHVAKYPVGRATFFNSYHYHNVFNPSAENRISLMLYLDLRNKSVQELFEAAIDNYRGEYVK
jgi:aspartyl/asparaginyl beta-hydroxylase